MALNVIQLGCTKHLPTAVDRVHEYDIVCQHAVLSINSELTQQDGWKTQDGRMAKKCRATLCISDLTQSRTQSPRAFWPAGERWPTSPRTLGTRLDLTRHVFVILPS